MDHIHTLNLIIEDAKENNKELWIMFQDMSKAYDRVNKKLLYRSLERICVPEDPYTLFQEPPLIISLHFLQGILAYFTVTLQS